MSLSFFSPFSSSLSLRSHDLVDILGASSLCDVAKVEAHCRRETKKDFSVARCGKFAYLFPAAQLGDELRQEELAVRTVLETKGKIGLATAYLNPPRDVAQRLAGAVVIAPSIASHGFAEAPDVRKNVPKAYQMIARDLVRNQPNLELLEWHDDHKSFHAKGVWLFREGRRRRRSWTTTIVGSSNMNARARLRDLELSFVMTTNNRRLSRALKGEWSRFKRQASAPWSLLSPPRDVPLWVRVFRPQINTFL